MKTCCFLFFSIIAFASTAQYSRSFYSTSYRGAKRSAIVADVSGQTVAASLKGSQSGTLQMTVVDLDDSGETSNYYEVDLPGYIADYFTISGYATNGNELILCVQTQTITESTLHYLRFDRSTNTVVQAYTLPEPFKSGFVRTRQTGNSMTTYLVSLSSGLIRVNTSLSDVSAYTTEVIDASIPAYGTLATPRKDYELLVTSSGDEYISHQSKVYKRSGPGVVDTNYLVETVGASSTAMTINDQNQLLVFSGNKYNVFNASTLAYIGSGSVTGIPLTSCPLLEVMADQGVVYFHGSSTSTAMRYIIDGSFSAISGGNQEFKFEVYDLSKVNNDIFVVGEKREPIYYSGINETWSIAVIREVDAGVSPIPFLEYNTRFDHYDLQANTGHLNVSMTGAVIENSGLLMKHGGVYKSMIFAAANSIVGYDQNNDLQGMISHYSAEEVFPGPYTPPGQDTRESYDAHNRAFYVTKDMIDYHRQYATYSSYEPPFGIRNWPAHGDTTIGQAFYVAPFYDENGNGVYDPSAGDYPLIYGDECYLNVYHLGDSTANFGTSTIGLECLQYIFRFKCDTSEALKHSVFMRQRYTLRSGQLNDAYISTYMDPDVGHYGDDFIGSHVDLGMIYGYNGDTYDENGPNSAGFHDTLAATGILMLQGAPVPADGIDNAPGVGTNQCVNGLGFGDGAPDNEYFTLVNAEEYVGSSSFPTNAVEYYNFFRGFFPDGSPQQLLGVDIRHSYFGKSDPQSYSSDGIYPGADNYEFGPISSNTPGDRSIAGGTGPVSLDASSSTANSVDIVNAYICSVDTVNLPNGNLIAPLDPLFAYGLALRNMYASNNAGCDNDFGFYVTPVPVGLNEITLNANVYPNPFTNELKVVLDDGELMEIRVVDLNGRFVAHAEGAGIVTLSTGNWDSGMYLLVIQSGDRTTQKRVVKQ